MNSEELTIVNAIPDITHFLSKPWSSNTAAVVSASSAIIYIERDTHQTLNQQDKSNLCNLGLLRIINFQTNSGSHRNRVDIVKVIYIYTFFK